MSTGMTIAQNRDKKDPKSYEIVKYPRNMLKATI